MGVNTGDLVINKIPDEKEDCDSEFDDDYRF